MKKTTRIFLALMVLVVFLLAGGLLKTYLAWKNHYQNRIYDGLKIGSLDLSGQTYDSALNLVGAQIKKLEQAGLTLHYNQRTANIALNVVAFDSDLSYPALVYDADATVKKALGEGGERGFWPYLLAHWGLSGGRNLSATYSLDENKIKELISDRFPDLNVPALNASFSMSASGAIKTSPERPGRTIAFEEVLDKLRTNLNELKNESIDLSTRSQYPTVKQGDLAAFANQAQAIFSGPGLSLQFSESTSSVTDLKDWTIRPEKLVAWLSVVSGPAGPTLSLDQDQIKKYLSATIAPNLDREAAAPRFEIKDGKVSSWQSGQAGRLLDQAATAAAITQAVLSGQKEVPLAIKTIESQSLSDDNLNIKEIIGTGHSNFVGSPPNRVHNIQVGAAAVNGLLIKPGEEFSLVKTLGDVSEKTNYLPELVIKGNKTVPEYGGGLCQIGTTVFRSALAAGLPITARQNHSYRVSYYEPAGMDAAIYIPNPDVRFINDTGNYILIQSRFKGTDLYFDFWGVSDGRVATTTTPVVFNIVKPEPTKIIESDSLKPGEKKCTEHAHNGADAYFDYTVIYPIGATTTPEQSTRFKSHYVPWQEVCLVGKATSTAATSTSLDALIGGQATSDPTASSSNQKATGTPAASSTTP